MTTSPDETSSDYKAMTPYRTMVDAILGGVEAMRAVPDYLPQFPNESTSDYTYRLANSKFTNVFSDIVDDLSARPFAEPLTLNEGASPRVEALAQDIDAQGNNLHVYANNWFHGGIAYSIEWTLVDYTKPRARPDGAPLSLQDEERQGLRPYFVRIPDKHVLAAYTAIVEGVEQFVHVRISEVATERKGYDEETVERVRILNRDPIIGESGELIGWAPATYEVLQKDKDAGGWSVVDAGQITIGVIPLVPFVTGRREGKSWRTRPPLKAAAELQIEMYQQETNLKSAKEATAFPMLSASGVSPDIEGGQVKPIPTGPKTVLYAPPYGENGQSGEWKYVEISANSLKFLAEEVDTTENQLRELGRQPLTAKSGNLTVVTTTFAAQKGNSAVQQWALSLQDAINQAMVYVAMWLNEPVERAATVTVFTDFALDMQDDKGPDVLLSMRAKGDLSRRTLWKENRRRNILAADFDPDGEEKALSEEAARVSEDAASSSQDPAAQSDPAQAA